MERKDFIKKMLLGSAGMVVATTSCSVIKSTYEVDTSKCTGCGDCLPACSFDAITIADGKAQISSSKCAGCGKCVSYCNEGAIA